MAALSDRFELRNRLDPQEAVVISARRGQCTQDELNKETAEHSERSGQMQWGFPTWMRARRNVDIDMSKIVEVS